MIGWAKSVKHWSYPVAGLFGLDGIEHTMFSDSDVTPSMDLAWDAFTKHTLLYKTEPHLPSAFGFVICR